jgi:hypothetical protein
LFVVDATHPIRRVADLTTTIIVTAIKPQGMRGTDVLQRRATGRPATAIEADMDRLFARRVTVFGPVSLGDSTEAVLNTVLKVRVQGLVCSEAVCVYDSVCACDV